MKKIIILISLTVLNYNICLAQKSELAVGHAIYNFIHLRDTTQRDKPYEEELNLFISKTSSFYSSADAVKDKAMIDNQIQEQLKNAVDPNKVSFNISGSRQVTTSEYFQFLAEKKLFVKQLLGGNPFLIEQSLPKMNWQIKGDTLTIKGLKCQLATTVFGGRDYNAWFCADMPFQTGPWKFNGLPGLIISVYDTKNEVSFKLQSFSDVRSKNILLTLPDDVIKITPEEFAKLEKLERTDPAAFSKMVGPGKNTGPFANVDRSKISSISIKKPKASFSNVINNPLELPSIK
ncbi:MAG: GLPGLI family protein [Bacteroidota bacterium]|uniref:GLPGLI family protein n=1 Tax=Pedobacter cryotolerans TaxID=2571270 RepID=A0A4U1BX73_9SPHI|nr:GLPGLI family protein [Pedobacter cryotolerans]TKB97258.1 GLPGLI family protein [Pedobacter cryotolerans]